MRKPLLTLLALPLLALGGCVGANSNANYAVDVRNRSAQPVSVELLARDAAGNLSWLAQPVRLGPGDRGGLGPVWIDPKLQATFRADTPGNPGRAVIFDLKPGVIALEVSQDGTAATSPLRVTEVR